MGQLRYYKKKEKEKWKYKFWVRLMTNWDYYWGKTCGFQRSRCWPLEECNKRQIEALITCWKIIIKFRTWSIYYEH